MLSLGRIVVTFFLFLSFFLFKYSVIAYKQLYVGLEVWLKQ
jgi:hypothetical protein